MHFYAESVNDSLPPAPQTLRYNSKDLIVKTIPPILACYMRTVLYHQVL